jgi:hypothetical protein
MVFSFSCCGGPGSVDIVKTKEPVPHKSVDLLKDHHLEKDVDPLVNFGKLKTVEDRSAWHFEGVMQELNTSPIMGRKKLHRRSQSTPEPYSTGVRSEYALRSGQLVVTEVDEYEKSSQKPEEDGQSPTSIADQNIFAPVHRRKSLPVATVSGSHPVAVRRKSLIFTPPTETLDMDWT